MPPDTHFKNSAEKTAMSTEKPQKRLVGWKQYLMTLMEKGGLYSSAVVVGCSGLVCLLGALTIPILGPDSHSSRFHPDEPTLISLLFLSGLSGALSCGALWATTALFKKAKRIEPVTPITRHNTGYLAEAETLVRAADTPPTDRQELLRAAGQGSATPATELLRAAHKNGQA